MDWKQLLEIASPITVIFVAGMLYQEIRTFRSELRDLREIREGWSALKVQVGTVKETQGKMLSDFKELRRRIDDTRDKLASSHDIGE